MKFILAFCFALICFSTFAQDKSFQIHIMQDGKEVIPQNGIVELNKKPFAIEVSLTNLEGVYLSAAFADSIYKLRSEDPIPNFKDIPVRVLVELEFNSGQEMIIEDDGWAYLFYDKKLDWNRFDKNSIRKDGETVTGTKTIRQFYFPEQEETLSTEKVSMPLYLFFVSVEKDKKGKSNKELERYKIQINWL
jgi:hypothetical protein